MLEIIKCVFGGFVFFMMMMVISGIMNYLRPAKSVDELLSYDSQTIYEQIDDSHKPNPDSTLSKFCNRNEEGGTYYEKDRYDFNCSSGSNYDGILPDDD